MIPARCLKNRQITCVTKLKNRESMFDPVTAYSLGSGSQTHHGTPSQPIDSAYLRHAHHRLHHGDVRKRPSMHQGITTLWGDALTQVMQHPQPANTAVGPKSAFPAHHARACVYRAYMPSTGKLAPTAPSAETPSATLRGVASQNCALTPESTHKCRRPLPN